MSRVELAYDSRGDGPPVLFAHAIAYDRRMWDRMLAHFGTNRRVIRADLRGHGQSPVPPGPYTLAELAGDCAALLDYLNVARVDFVGLSLGGMVGQAFALGHPDRLGRLVLANTSSSYGPEGRAMWEARKKLVREGGLAAVHDLAVSRNFTGEFRGSHAKVVADAMATFLASPVEGYLGCCDAIAGLDFTEVLPLIAAPTLVIAGGLDPGTPVAMSRNLAERIPGAKLVVIDGAAHLSAVEKPAEFARLVDVFLAD
jgi:3-oxoadipate enol-lactonase